MRCDECRFWQGHRLSQEGDCYRVVAKLEPNLLGCYRKQDEEDESSPEIYFRIPFDLHDIKEYWTHHPFIRKLHRVAERKTKTMDGIRVERVEGVPYFVTRKEFDCEGI
jgi:hypothetical protein